MAKSTTSIGFFLIFLLLQFIQGVLITVFLRRELHDINQWIWLVGDVLLLLFWMKMIHYRKRMIMQLDMPIAALPTMTVAWATYLVIVFIPRILWLMIGVGTCLGKSDRDLSLTAAEHDAFYGLHNFTMIELDADALTSSLSILSTIMLFCLVLSGYRQHGLLKTYAPIDFDTAEAAFCVLDAVQFLRVLFDAPDVGLCSVTMEMENSTWHSVSPSSTVSTTPYVPNNSDTEYVAALEGILGKFILALVIVSFTVPLIALWQFHRQSNVVKVTTKVKDHAKRLRSLASQPSQVGRWESQPSQVGRWESQPSQVGRWESQPSQWFDETSLSSPTTSVSTSSALPLKPLLTSMASFSEDEAKTTTSSTSSTSTGSSSSGSDIHVVLEYNNEIRMYEEDVRRWARELSTLKLVYTLLDIFVINLPAAAIRFLLWIRFERPISALLAKHVLAVLFRTVGLVNNYKYVIPCCNRSVKKDAEDPANDIATTPLTHNAATSNRAVPKSGTLDVNPEQLPIPVDAAESEEEEDDPPVYHLTTGRRMSIATYM